MKFLNKVLSRILRSWDPRPVLAKEWLESAEKYEERLRTNPSLNQQVVEVILQERGRIRALFRELLPEFGECISIVVSTDTQVEHCAVFSWNDHLYVLVSAALIGRSCNHPTSNGFKAWEWLSRHEAAHIRDGHLPWLFHTRRLFRLTFVLCYTQWLLLKLFASRQMFYEWLEPSLWLLGGLWLIQTVVALALEWKADLIATRSVTDPIVLKETENSLARMGIQARKRFVFPLGWIQYAVSLLFFDPHPPLAARRWLLRRRLRILESTGRME